MRKRKKKKKKKLIYGLAIQVSIELLVWFKLLNYSPKFMGLLLSFFMNLTTLAKLVSHNLLLEDDDMDLILRLYWLSYAPSSSFFQTQS